MRHTLPFRSIAFVSFLCILFVIYYSNIHEKLNIKALTEQEQYLKALTSLHPFIVSSLYLLIYTASVFLVIPDSTVLTLLGGMLFPLPLAVTYALIGETAGAFLFFLLFTAIFKENKFEDSTSFLHKIREEFNKAPTNYLLFLRLSHILPFWSVSLAGAYFKVSYNTFVWTTAVGSLPLCYLLANAGKSLQPVLQTQSVHISEIFTTQVKCSLLLIGLCALIPIVYKKIKKRDR